MAQKRINRIIEFEIIEPEPVIKDNYEIMRIRLMNNNSMPLDLINPSIQHFFTSSANIIHKYEPTILLVRMKIKDLLNAPIINWCQNRDPDLVRIPDIASYIYNKRKSIETIIYISFNNKKQNFDVIDGIHRFTALKYIKEKNSVQLDLLDNQPFGSNLDATWLYNSDIIVNIRFNADTGELISLREVLNKSQPMPTVLMDDSTVEKQIRSEIIKNISNEWQVKYTKNFSSSNDPTYLQSIGSTNKDLFQSLLGVLYEKYNIDISRVNILKKILEEANKRMEEKVIKSSIGSSKARVKCKDSGCYLFIYRNEKLEDFI
jgi:hypothetical protein